MCFNLRRVDTQTQLPWLWLCLFCLGTSVHDWLQILEPIAKFPKPIVMVRLFILTATAAALFEFGRKSFRKTIGRWSTLGFFIIVVLLGVYQGIESWNNLRCYILILPGGLLTSVTMWRASQGYGKSLGRFGLQLTSVSIFCMSIIWGMVAPEVAFWPSTWLNYESFAQITGISVQIFLIGFGLLVVIGLNLHQRGLLPPSMRADVLASATFHLVIIALLIAGASAMNWSAAMRQQDIQRELWNITTNLAEEIDTSLISNLDFTDTDKQNNAFKQLQKQMYSSTSLLSGAVIHSVVEYRKKLLIYSTNAEKEIIWSVHPNLNQDAFSLMIQKVLYSGSVVGFGTQTDTYGAVATVFAPVINSTNGTIMMAVGTGMTPFEWERSIAASRLTTIFAVLVLIILLLIWKNTTANFGRNISLFSSYIANRVEIIIIGLISLFITAAV
ncbi:MAG: hypothetical protein JW841_15500, partial [Deltaproteobacteria bacterium]|nr:hypothetical protein [Deltaproteobacteria bacterium]